MLLVFEWPETDNVSWEPLKISADNNLEGGGWDERDEESADFSILLSVFNENQALQDHAI